MSPLRARRLAWALAALALALMLGGNALLATARAVALTAADPFLTSICVSFTVVGSLVASRRSRNPIGWIFLGVALWTALCIVAYGFVEHRLDAGGDPGTWAGVAAVFYEFKWLGFVVVPTTFLLLLFPDGRLLTDRWRPIAICTVIGILGVLVTGSATTDPLADTPGVQNPFATDSPVWSGLNILAILFLYVGIFGSAACVVVRFRRAGHVQRQQIKWLAASGAIVAVIGPLDAAFSGVTGDAAFVATVAGITCLPAAVGIGILRHRLYDIDVVINRTLVYGALTATLAGAYLGAVLLLQLALSPLTSSSSLAIAISTLAVAALFQPARGRIQAVVDRRFYRRKYDAARTLEAFGARLRVEVDLDALAVELRAVVDQAMQPAHVSLWLRTPQGGR